MDLVIETTLRQLSENRNVYLKNWKIDKRLIP